MCPRLFQIGPFTIYGYGLMLALAFIIASYVMARELKRRGMDPNIGSTITLIALVAGVVGSKILYLIEDWSQFLADPIGTALSPGGLTFYGGFLLATYSIYVYVRKKKIRFLTMADIIAPSLMLAYGIGRLGCQLAGDGDYGFPTTLPWGTDYSKGTYPPSLAFQNFPEIANRYPGGVVPDNTLCQPTPVYEFILCALLFVVLWRTQRHLRPEGKVFMLYLITAGLERFSIEFIRLNPRILFGLTEGQLISGVLILVGLAGWIYLSRLGDKKTHDASR